MLTRNQYQNLAHFLLPYVDAKRMLIRTVVFGTNLEYQINWQRQPSRDFALVLVRQLLDFGELEAGKLAIIQVLQALRDELGVDKQRVLDVWIAIIQAQSSTRNGVDTSSRRQALLDILDNLTTQPAILFDTMWLGLSLLVLDNTDPQTLSEPMQVWFATQGRNAIFDLINRTANGEPLSPASVANIAEHAIVESDIAGLFQRDDWLLRVPDGIGSVIALAEQQGYVDVLRILVTQTCAMLDGIQQSAPTLFDELDRLRQQVNQLSGSLQTVDIPVPSTPTHLKVFLSSPGDVPQERKIVQEVITNLSDNLHLRGKLFFEVVAWDKPGAGTPMLATMTPQEAINQGMPKPSDCDIVVVIFWSRMGTPLPHPEYQKVDGSQYLSGTEWEFWDAFYAAKDKGLPLLVVYRRTEEPKIGMKDTDFMAKYEQYQRVNSFFASFTNPDGSIKQGYNMYTQPEDFRREFETHLRKLVARLITEQPQVQQPAQPQVPAKATWQGSPFPGLRAFTEKEAEIFFGRGRETDKLVQMVGQSRFVAVVGASGSGKSSLVGAGLIPRLRENALYGSGDWYIVRLTPGEKPFLDLAEALIGIIPALAGDPIAFVTLLRHWQAFYRPRR